MSIGKIDKLSYFTGEEVLSSRQGQIIQQVKFIYFALRKELEKQIKTMEDQGGNNKL